jgi:hypothetical protein
MYWFVGLKTTLYFLINQCILIDIVSFFCLILTHMKLANCDQIQIVRDFNEFLNQPLRGTYNAICWERHLVGDFAEIVAKIETTEDIVVVSIQQLKALQLTPAGNLARNIILSDMEGLTQQGAAPLLNLIKRYERDDPNAFFPTDVYSFHVDRSPIPVDTILCTYFGAPSEFVPNKDAVQKCCIPEIRARLKELFNGPEADFDAFLTEYFFDLHYQLKPGVQPINFGLGNLWKIAVDYPESQVLPCIHRAPVEKNGQTRLLLIC